MVLPLTSAPRLPSTGMSPLVVSRRFSKGDRQGGHGMRVIKEITDPWLRMHTMTERKSRSEGIDVKAVLSGDDAFIRAVVRVALQEVLEAAGKGERTPSRVGYRSGYYGRTLITRVGKLELRVPQDRDGRFSTELFERYRRSERALVAALAEMYVQGVSTRKVKTITEELTRRCARLA